MSISRKMYVFITILILSPMIVSLHLSSIILDQQLEKSAKNYLVNASKLAENKMNSRRDEMEKSIRSLSLLTTNHLDQELNSTTVTQFVNVYNYIDFIVVMDKNYKMLTSYPQIQGLQTPEIKNLLKIASKSKNSISSIEVLPLNKLFDEYSIHYKQFQIGSSNFTPFNQALTILAVSPIYQNEQISGYILTADILNKDDYFPSIYTNSIEDSFLSISLNEVRITSNIQSPDNYNFIGSTIPVKMSQLKDKQYYFGRVIIDNETHLFLDIPIKNQKQEVIGALGVGIPEKTFTKLINTNRYIIFVVSISFLFVMLYVGRNISDKISKPITKATELAKQISFGNKNIKIDEACLRDDKNETTILLRTIQNMAYDLRKNEQELKAEHEKQRGLAIKLKHLNNDLEDKVNARTQELSQAIEALKKADDVKSRFLANMSHELRTPLSSIICSSEAIKDEILGPINDKQRKYIENNINSANHLLQLINDILDISKIQAGMMKLNIGTYSINDVINESLSVIRSLANRKNIDISVLLEPKDFIVEVDAKKIKQILYNLLSNAVKFTPNHGKIFIRIYKRGDLLQIIIKDTGIGIKKEDQERVFREFEQVDNSYEKHYEGTGLGLPLTKKLVEMHGGEIYLKSELNKGTEVLITMPIFLNK